MILIAVQASSAEIDASEMSFVSAVSFTVRNVAQAQRWYPALVNAQLVQNGGFLVAGRAPATLARVVVQNSADDTSHSPESSELSSGSLQPGISFPYLGIATSNMTKSRRDLERFGGPLDAGAGLLLGLLQRPRLRSTHTSLNCS